MGADATSRSFCPTIPTRGTGARTSGGALLWLSGNRYARWWNPRTDRRRYYGFPGTAGGPRSDGFGTGPANWRSRPTSTICFSRSRFDRAKRHDIGSNAGRARENLRRHPLWPLIRHDLLLLLRLAAPASDNTRALQRARNPRLLALGHTPRHRGCGNTAYPAQSGYWTVGILVRQFPLQGSVLRVLQKESGSW
jgi:hypothetical protein